MLERQIAVHSAMASTTIATVNDGNALWHSRITAHIFLLG